MKANLRLGRQLEVVRRGVVLPLLGLRRVPDAEAEAPGEALDAVRQAIRRVSARGLVSHTTEDTYKSGGASELFFSPTLCHSIAISTRDDDD